MLAERTPVANPNGDSTPRQPTARHFDQPARRRIGPGTELAGRFLVGRPLGTGGMGQVYSAFDRIRQSDVAVKLLVGFTPQSIGHLKREFRSAAGLAHPNLVRLHELFCDGPEWFFSMDLIDGMTLPELSERHAASPVILRHVFRQLAGALRALHRAGTLHSDLKPSNFLITGAEHRVVLLDFGLARPIGLAESREAAGTPAYMAPEQALSESLTEAADWYSFGVVLYEALTGTLPLWRPSSELLASAPEDLRTLCVDLLKLSPLARPTGEEVVERIGNTLGDGTWSQAPPSASRALIGRDGEVKKLLGAFEATLRGRAALVLIHGPSGIGKTTLAAHGLAELRARSAFVLAGACRERESMSYKAVDGLIDGVVALLADFTPEEVRALLPPGIAELVVLFPSLRAAPALWDFPGPRADGSDQALVRLRAIGAFRELIVRLRRLRPLVLFVDDLQWSDAESALLLGPLLSAPDPVPLLFIGGMRQSAEGRGPLLDALFGDRHLALPEPVELALGPLDEADAERLALAILPQDSQAAAGVALRIGRDAGGHPLFIAELAHAAGENEGMAEPPAAQSLSELISARASGLPSDAARLLTLLALCGTPLPRRVLRLAGGFDTAHTEAAIDVLKASRLARSDGLRDDDGVEIHHDRIREIIVHGVPDATRARHHLSLAHALETWAECKSELLALHYESGGELRDASRRWILAADQAARSLAFAHAADLYERGLRHAGLNPLEVRTLEVRLAEALARAGKGPAAATVYLSAAKSSTGAEALDLRRRAGEALLLSGHLDPGLQVMAEVLGAASMGKMKSGRGALVSALLGRVLVRVRGLRHVVREESSLPREELVRLDASFSLSASLGVIDPIRGAAFQAKHLLLALSAGEKRRTLRALTLEACYTSRAGVSSEERTAKLLRVADELARDAGDPGASALLLIAHGASAYLEGRLTSALGSFEQALALLTEHCPGAVWETVTAQRFLIASLFFLGRLGRLQTVVPPLLARAEGTGNLYASMCFRTAYSWAAWLARDEVSHAREQIERAGREWETTSYQLSHCNVLIGSSYIDLYSGDPEGAHERLLVDWPKITDAQLLRIGILRAEMWRLRGLSAALAADGVEKRGDLAHARELRAEARSFAQKLCGEALGRAAALGASIDAALARSAGDTARERRELEHALTVFERHGLSLFAAATRARVGRLVGGDEGSALVSSALAAFESEGVTCPEKLMRMLVPGELPG